VNIATDKLSLK